MKHWPYPKLVAHRGGGKLAPENTLAGMRTAHEHGFMAVEFDVKLSADGVAMLMHDDTLERTTNGNGLFRDHTATQLATLDAGAWKDVRYQGEPIPRLDAVMHYLASHRMLANVEIKPCHGGEAETGRAVALLAGSLAADQVHKPLLSSFSVAALRAATIAAPSLPRALLVERYSAADDDVLAELGCVALNCAWNSVEPVMLAHLHARGLHVMAYTVNEVVVAERLFALGVDGIFTDTLDMMAASFPSALAAQRPVLPRL